ncbi:MAG TPA: uridine kinase [Pseudomonadota bacterium]|nr:uridine kinase [Pseudomonadota bacterium]HNF96438.1 uridine kinase [Pseudomonadota bacterium]HNK43487.1 uridine kinase [Pseudomonadota bacterium]HNN50498.1 uridine kinase [Pseudomonadota bacterium]HNO68626.1 uridine kinase [Pseudomonadota bacterium]
MNPLVIGVAGGTGSGKSTVAAKIVEGLPSQSVVILDHDSYYRDRSDLTPAMAEQLNYDHPDSLETDLLVDQLRRLKSGQAIDMPQYDFKTHSRLKTRRRVEPAPVIVVEGILLFVEPDLRALLDIKLFVDTDADIRILRRIRRDLEHRGRTFQSIREQYYKTVRPMHLQFVEPSKRWADIIIPEGGENRVALDLVIGRLQHYLSDHVHPQHPSEENRVAHC